MSHSVIEAVELQVLEFHSQCWSTSLHMERRRNSLDRFWHRDMGWKLRQTNPRLPLDKHGSFVDFGTNWESPTGPPEEVHLKIKRQSCCKTKGWNCHAKFRHPKFIIVQLNFAVPPSAGPRIGWRRNQGDLGMGTKFLWILNSQAVVAIWNKKGQKHPKAISRGEDN